MAISGNPFSMSTMLNALQQTTHYPKGISVCIPPPGFTTRASVETARATRLNYLFNLMTSSEGVSHFKEKISTLDKIELQRMVSLLTLDSDYFLEIARNKNGSLRLQKLLGKSDDTDALFCAVIMRRFLDIMTDKYASYVAVRAMVVFNQEMKFVLYEYTLRHALDSACDQHGCIALNEILTDADDSYHRNELLDLVARNAVFLSNDASGNFVIQHVLKLIDLRCTLNIAVYLRGHCVELSFKKYGSYIVEKLLEAEESVVVVVEELLECQGDRLLRLARSEYGNFVVCKALRMTKEIRVDMFWGLVQKLKPFVHLLRRSHGSNIANILESV